MDLKRDWSMNSHLWLTTNSNNLKQSDIIVVSIRGVKCIGIVLVDVTYPYITVPLLVDGYVKVISLLEKERKLATIE